MIPPPQGVSRNESPQLTAVPTSQYSFEELADIYNQTRIDYIVPMPMNAKRMKEYVQQHAVDLEASVISINSHQEVTGVCMIAFRDDRAWITRLGVIPEKRLHKNGQFLAEKCLDAAESRSTRLVQLEVIKGNEPARQLFLKLGFQDVRELLIIRRPPGKPTNTLPTATTFTPIPDNDIPTYLNQRGNDAAWIEESPSLLSGGNLKGIRSQSESGKDVWLIYQRTLLQITHITFSPETDEKNALTLLGELHKLNSMQDTKIENLPADSPLWAAYQQMGYLEVFRRIEMHRRLR